MLQLLKDELQMCMRLMGTPTVGDIEPGMIQTRNISDHFAAQAPDSLQQAVYEPLSTIYQQNGNISKL